MGYFYRTWCMRHIRSSASWTIALCCEQFLLSHLSWTLVVIVEESPERDSLVWVSETNKCNERTSEKTDTKSMQESSAKLWQKRRAKLRLRRWNLDNREARGKKRSLLAGQQKTKRFRIHECTRLMLYIGPIWSAHGVSSVGRASDYRAGSSTRGLKITEENVLPRTRVRAPDQHSGS